MLNGTCRGGPHRGKLYPRRPLASLKNKLHSPVYRVGADKNGQMKGVQFSNHGFQLLDVFRWMNFYSGQTDSFTTGGLNH